MIYESSKYIYDFRKFQTIRSFAKLIKKQSNLLDVILNFNYKVRPGSKEDKEKKSNTYKSENFLYQDRELTLNAFKN